MAIEISLREISQYGESARPERYRPGNPARLASLREAKRRWMMGVLGVMSVLFTVPSVWAADGEVTAEAAQVGATDAQFDQIRSAIAAETDPELRNAMEEQLHLLEAGQIDLTRDQDLALGAPPEVAGGSVGTGGLPGGLPGGGGLVGPPVPGGEGTEMPSYMTPELKEQLFKVYDGVASGEVSEQEARTKAEEILKEHGIDPREMGPGPGEGGEHDRGDWEQRGESWEAMERGLEQMSPEAREQMERFFEAREGEYQGSTPELEHEMSGREFEMTTEQSFEAPTHEYEAMTHEYEAPAQEYEAPEQTYEAPEQTYEAPEQNYEAPEQTYEAPEQEYQAPEYNNEPQGDGGYPQP